MPKVKPFCATRPTRDKVSLIASRPYESYSKAEREARLDHNPFSFLHIVNPGYKYQKEISGRKAFGLVKNRFEEFKEDGSFIRDKNSMFYLHQIVLRNSVKFTGIVACCHADDYQKDLIKIHEDTLSPKVKMFSEYLKTVRFNADPVLITYPDNQLINKIAQQVSKKRAEYEFTTTSRETHHFWLIDDASNRAKIEQEFDKMSHLYIADGHHRFSSSAQLAKQIAKENPKHNGDEAYNYIMSYLIPESQLRIHEYNRLVKDLNGYSKEEFLIQLDEFYRIENRGQQYYKPLQKNHFSMYLDGEFYSLYLRKNQYQAKDALDSLDAQILYKTVLKPILGIEDLRSDDRIGYSQSEKDMAYVKGNIDSKAYEVGFGMFPVSIDEIKSIADQGLKMPPKTTYIQPKLRSGISIHEF
ncbi:MAG: DUF1015 domain-containing protein [Bacteroidota bacterium]